MTAILRNLPFREQADEVSCGLERIPLKPYQIIVWMSLTARDILVLPPGTPRFPVILDTAHNHNFSLQERHLTQWARVAIATLPQLRRIREGDRQPPLHAATLWLHANVPGKRDEFREAPPLRLAMDQGIAIYLGATEFPRLPLLGLRALVRNKLHFWMDPENCVVQLRTPDWRTWLHRIGF